MNDAPGRLKIGKCAESEQDLVGHGSDRNGRAMATDPSATENKIAIIENGCLAGRDRALGLVQPDASTVIFLQCDRGRSAGMTVTDLDRHFALFCRRSINPVAPIDFELLANEVLDRADD